MPYAISDKCDNCGECQPECPGSAIYKGDPIYYIKRAECTDCGVCADICHVHAPYQEDVTGS